MKSMDLAEGMGFEPTVEVDPLQQFSKLPPSATRPPLRRESGARHMQRCLYQRRPRCATKGGTNGPGYFSATLIPRAVAGRAIIESYQRFTSG